ncbi:MAG TPA: protein kinase, partial [Gemmataceae bacterium]|nr:protein kinase [Gemmataceae bacterium]
MPADANAVKAIFLAAIDRPTAAERDSYLHEACAGDTELRQRVDALLKAHAESGSFPDFAALAEDSGVTEGMAPTPDDVTVTRTGSTAHSEDSILGFLAPARQPENLGRLGDYEIQSVIGQGGMGVVLRALDERLGRIVAIKILAPQYAANAAARKRFLREAKAIAAVTHEHVVAVHFVSGDKDPHPYLVMQLVQGVSLQERLDQTGPLEVKEILRIGLQTARGLAAAHAQGLVHRDIKPANILLENGVERVKITDFGLARAVDDASVTTSGVIAGTPMFMSPEQAEGKQVDARSDLFSLGSVLYALCTGRPPFRATGTMAVMKRVIEDNPRPIREVNPDLPDWLEAIIAKLHAKKPEDRFQSAKEVAELLEQHLAHLQQPSKVPMPAMVEVPVAKTTEPAPEERPWKQLLDAPDYFKRLVQHTLALLAFGCIVLAFVSFLSLVSAGPSGAIIAAGVMILNAAILTFVCSLVRQKWIVQYKGRFIRFENSAVTGMKLFVDGQRVARGGIAIEQEFYATIPEGPGAGDQLRVLAYAGFFSFRCQIFVTEAIPAAVSSPPQKAISDRLARARRRRRWSVAIPVLAGMFVIAAVLLGRPMWLYSTNTGELTISIENPPEFQRFEVVLVPGREMRTGNGTIQDSGIRWIVKPGQALNLQPGKYWVEAFDTNGSTVSRWREEGGGVLAGYSTYKDEQKCTVEVKRGERVKLSIINWSKAPSLPATIVADKDVLQGTWVVDPAVLGSAQFAGQELTAEEAKQIKLVFTGGQVRFHMPGGKVEGGTFKLDSSVKPKEMDVIDMNDQKGLFGIYDLYGDVRLSIRMGQEKTRPKDWTSRLSTTEWMLVLHRAQAEPQSDKDLLQGTWIAESAELAGQQQSPAQVKELKVVFTAGHVRVTRPGGKVQSGTFKLDTSVSPKEFDAIGDDDHMGMIGIYKFEGDRLHFCFSEEKERPKEFKSQPGKRFGVLVLRREPVCQYGADHAIPDWGVTVDPQKNCNFAATSSDLTISVPPGHRNLNPAPPFQNVSAPRVLQKVKGDFDIRVQVLPFSRPKPGTSSNGLNSYVGDGLLLW